MTRTVTLSFVPAPENSELEPNARELALEHGADLELATSRRVGAVLELVFPGLAPEPARALHDGLCNMCFARDLDTWTSSVGRPP